MKSRLILTFSVLIVLALGAAWVLGAASVAADAEPLQVETSMSKDGNLVTYHIVLVNKSAEDKGDIYLAGLVPPGATFVKASATPAGSWFRGFEGAGSAYPAAVWLSAKVAKNSSQGPFSYQVSVTGDAPAAHAWASWKSPTAASTTSPQSSASRTFAANASGYTGSEACSKCHPGQYNDFRASGHPFKLQPASEAKYRMLPLPDGYTWNDISYVIGGANWKARYLDKQGYIITSAGGKPGKNQYNIAAGTWSDYEAGKQKRYDCGSCHTTGYSTEGKQDGLPGMVGTWALPGIQCEACHGPGAQHAKTAAKADIKVDRSSAACGQCHIRNKADTIPAKAGFIEHHEQYNELLAGPHKAVSCVTCHNPHKAAEFSIKTDCASCHATQAGAFKGSAMQKVGVKCMDCHMPEAAKSAVAPSKNQGDVKAHIFKINTDPTASMFSEDGLFAKGFVTLNFACLRCHADKTVDWAAAAAKQAHTLGK